MWTVNATDEYLQWFAAQDSKAQQDILSYVLILQEFGPQLGRPYADTLKGSRIMNLKELRVKSSWHVFRIAYYFDPDRNALLLVGGDKKGQREKDFYKKLIEEAETLIRKYRETEE